MKALEGPVSGYKLNEIGDGNATSVLINANNRLIKLRSRGEDLERHFECFCLEVSSYQEKLSCDSFEPWVTSAARVELLMRREGLFRGQGSHSCETARKPKSVQKILDPRKSDLGADAICINTAGVCITSVEGNKLIVFADTFPYKMQIITDQDITHDALSKFELIKLSRYINRLD